MWVEQRALPARQNALGAWRTIVVDLFDRQPAQRRRQLAGIADRRARETEHRIGAVVLADAPQSAQDVSDVTTENAAQRVELVDDDIAQTHEERGPALVR